MEYHREKVPGAIAMRAGAFLVALASVIACIALTSRRLCDGQTNFDTCGGPTTHPHMFQGWLILVVGLGAGVILFALSYVYQELVAARRLAEAAEARRLAPETEPAAFKADWLSGSKR